MADLVEEKQPHRVGREQDLERGIARHLAGEQQLPPVRRERRLDCLYWRVLAGGGVADGERVEVGSLPGVVLDATPQQRAAKG